MSRVKIGGIGACLLAGSQGVLDRLCETLTLAVLLCLSSR